MKHQILLIIVAFFVVSCSPAAQPTSAPSPDDTAVSDPSTGEPMENPTLSVPDDSKFIRGNIFIEESGLLIRESYPPQISLNLSGNLPTPCHQFRADVSEPDNENKINIDVYTVVDPNMMCTQVLKPFTESVDLGTFPTGHYAVWVNGESVGEFDS